MRFLSCLLALSMLSIPLKSYATEEVFTIKKPLSNTQEYFAGGYPGSVMMKVNLMGAVNKPGVYNVPIDSELHSVLSYAGGPSREAKMKRVMVRSRKGESFDIKKVNLEKFFSEASEKPMKLKPDDYVYIESKQFISSEVLQTSTLVASILGVIVSVVIIDQRLRD